MKKRIVIFAIIAALTTSFILPVAASDNDQPLSPRYSIEVNK